MRKEVKICRVIPIDVYRVRPIFIHYCPMRLLRVKTNSLINHSHFYRSHLFYACCVLLCCVVLFLLQWMRNYNIYWHFTLCSLCMMRPSAWKIDVIYNFFFALFSCRMCSVLKTIFIKFTSRCWKYCSISSHFGISRFFRCVLNEFHYWA